MSGVRRHMSRVSPSERGKLRRAIVEQPAETLESISRETRRDDPEYQEFLKAGSRRSGVVTATESGAKRLAGEADLSRIVRMRRVVKKAQRQKAAEERGKFT